MFLAFFILLFNRGNISRKASLILTSRPKGSNRLIVFPASLEAINDPQPSLDLRITLRVYDS